MKHFACVSLTLFALLVNVADAQYYRHQRRDDAFYTTCPTCGALVLKSDVRTHRLRHEQQDRDRRDAAEDREMQRRREERDAIQAARAADAERIRGMRARVEGVASDWASISSRLAESEYQNLVDGDGTNLLRSVSSSVRAMRTTYAEAEGSAARETTAETRRSLIRQLGDAVRKAETDLRRVREYKRSLDLKMGRTPIPEPDRNPLPDETSDEPERMVFTSVMVLRRETPSHFVCKRLGSQGDPFLVDLSLLSEENRAGLSQGKRVTGSFFRYGGQTATATYRGSPTEMPLLVYEIEE